MSEPEPRRLAITGTGWAGQTQIELDGRSIVPGLMRLTLVIDAAAGPSLHLDLARLAAVDCHIDGDRRVTVNLPGPMVEVLLAAGWTPPERAPAANEGLTAHDRRA